jgi:WD40 repeat protein
VFDLCISPARNMVVSASADHGLRVFNLATGRLERELFTKTAGHKEWVTTCDIAHHSGRVLSGGMDFAVCVWEANSTKVRLCPMFLDMALAHSMHPHFSHHMFDCASVFFQCGFIGPFDGPVTKVSADDGWRAMTSSMDGSVKLWYGRFRDGKPACVPLFMNSSYVPCVYLLLHCSFRDIRSTHSARELQSYTGHSKGATTFRWTSTFCVSAERGGQLHVWDLETAQATHVLPAHTGAVVNALQLLSDPAAGAVSGSPFSERVVPNLIVSGGTDGYLRVYDLRTDRVVSQRRISGGRTGAGAVSDIAVWGWGAGAAEARADVVAYEVAARPSACDTDPGHAYDGTDSVDAGDGQRDYSQYGAQPVSYAGRGGAAVAGGMSDYLIAAGLTDGAVTVIDPRRSFMSTLSLQGPRAPVMAVRVAPSGRHVIATTADGACYAWDVRQSVPEREQPRLGAAPPPVPCRNPSWGMGVTEGPNSEEAHAVVRGGNGGRAVGCLQVWAGGAVCAGEDGQPLILTMG